MRRKDREVRGRKALSAILDECQVLRLGIHADGWPYVVPMNFGYVWEERLRLYCHCALEGRKMDLLRQDPRAAFEMDCSHMLKDGGNEACSYGYAYASIMGEGAVRIQEDPERKRAALEAIMRQVAGRSGMEFNEAVLARTAILEIEVLSITGKRCR
jgi:nitroimidazol reductase NimA-like FMN-containing flavoprotein (pyridoxamine 5'-phosphate oxidase superfamily)